MLYNEPKNKHSAVDRICVQLKVVKNCRNFVKAQQASNFKYINQSISSKEINFEMFHLRFYFFHFKKNMLGKKLIGSFC